MIHAALHTGKPLLALILCVLCFFRLSAPALAEDVRYPGAPLEYIEVSDSLAPSGSASGKSNSLSGNSVTVNSGTISGNVYGAVNLNDTDAVTNNRVFIKGGEMYEVVGGESHHGAATGNSVILSGGRVANGIIGGAVSNDADASRNSVTVLGGEAGSVVGGSARNGNASHNDVTVLGGLVTGSIQGGYSSNGSASGNRVIIGGSARARNGVEGGRSTGDASGNVVIVTGGIFDPQYDDFIRGGYSFSGKAIHNTVTISGAPVGLETMKLIGGGASSSMDVFTGNTLNFQSANLTVEGVSNFQYLNFHLPASWGAGNAMLIIASSGTASLTDGGTRSSVVGLSIDGAAAPLKTGDQFLLIDASAGTLSGTPENASADALQGVTLKYGFDIQTIGGNQILATVSGGPRVNERAKALSEGNLAGLALINQGVELVAGQGLAAAVGAARRASLSTGRGLGVFGAISGGWSRYDTGSHLDMGSVSLMTGLAWGAELAPGFLTVGAFLEYGNGAYDTYNSFSNAASVHGDGDVYHVGGGVAGRMDFASAGPGRAYAEASLSAGGVHNEYDSADLRDGTGRKAKYDSSSAWYGFHLGGGYLWKITESASLDLHGKYFQTRQEGDSVRLSTGDKVKFRNADSSRLRLGGRLNWTLDRRFHPYVGLAWEHEYDGKAKASVYGHALDAPSLRGDTGIGEVGFTYAPSATLPLTIDFGVQGYAGKREGATGSLRVKYLF
ncbi:MAG: autotransporter outer membrane beta-barrel domain-containing protein [Zoogloeaceae bacterium]|jgi:outer membrane autotransporter protein|nr:autotransporter outer membrane beta-barrel domain-containing protein [Zoogloeaceae bacterium]